MSCLVSATLCLCIGTRKVNKRDSPNSRRGLQHRAKLYKGRDLKSASRMPVALTSTPRVLPHVKSTETPHFGVSYKQLLIIILMHKMLYGMICNVFVSDQFHPGIFLSWSQPLLRVRSRLQPCRYWLFDQAWESTQLWKDKLAASLLTNCYKPITSS